MRAPRHLIFTLALCVSLFAGWRMALAQPAAGDRVALVIGNAAYPNNPLDNPKNDATAMAELLARAGFEVDRQLDTSQQQLKAAVDRFGASIRNPKVKFAMFYYAGHGVQLDWRNYLIPVNAKVQTADDVRRQTVDVSELLRHMEGAKGKSFLVILDACRDDPFAGSYRPKANGLSQFDAPSGSMLAYSTSPGKVALDGEKGNGLYTSHLLREFAVQGTRLEDAFKRVRLNVRLASKGRQVPWESTSLEDDVVLFPAARSALTDAEKDRLLEQEINQWLQIKNSTDVSALANFLRDYPSGSASELAQARLNRLLASASPDGSAALVRAAAPPAQLAIELQDLQRRHTAAREAAERAEAQRVAVAREMEQQLAKAIEEARTIEAQRQVALRVAAEKLEAERLADRRRLEAEMALAARRTEEDTRLRAEQAARQRQTEVAQQQQQERWDAEQRRLAQVERDATAQVARLAQERTATETARAAAAERAATAAAQAQAQEARLRQQQAEQTRLALQQREQALAETARIEARQAELQSQQQAVQLAAAPTGPAEPIAATPYFKGYAEHDRRYGVNDQFQFRVIDGFSKSERPLSLQVTLADAANDRVEYNNGEYASDYMGNIIRNLRGGMSTPRQFYPAELFVGKKWRTEFKQSRPNGTVYTFYYDLKVVAKETITVPAGTFDAYKIEARGFNKNLGARLERNIWVSPGVSADIAHETLVRLANGTIEQNERQELVAVRLGPRPATN